MKSSSPHHSNSSDSGHLAVESPPETRGYSGDTPDWWDSGAKPGEPVELTLGQLAVAFVGGGLIGGAVAALFHLPAALLDWLR